MRDGSYLFVRSKTWKSRRSLFVINELSRNSNHCELWTLLHKILEWKRENWAIIAELEERGTNSWSITKNLERADEDDDADFKITACHFILCHENRVTKGQGPQEKPRQNRETKFTFPFDWNRLQNGGKQHT